MPPIAALPSTSSAQHNRRHIPAGGTAAMTVALLTRAWASLRRRHRQRLTRLALEVLDDRTLRDIGIERSEIASIVRTEAVDRRTHYSNPL